ncbi:sequestosome-1 [Anaeramoeba flamelloides]|uniref:Sequestosome-1 n=1 Tax=Anaeramoeba flamelloides TaxID=1746091 RepID=A0AAV7YMA8_9EUKA|nr:sequestosome-1 [Anaeramoeba flamelloides]
MINNNPPKTIQVKAFFNQQYRRFSIPTDCEIDELWDFFYQVLKIPLEDREKYQLHYEDDEKEYILFSSTYELKEAIKYFGEQKNPIFRLTITKVDQITSRIPQNFLQSYDPLYGSSVNNSYQSFVKSLPNRRPSSSKRNQNYTKQPYFVPVTLSSYLNGYILEDKAIIKTLMDNEDVVKWFKENLKQFTDCSFDLSKYGGTQIEVYQVQIQSMIELTKFDEETAKLIQKVADNWKNRIIMIRSQLGSGQLINFFKNNAIDHLQLLFNTKNSNPLPTGLKAKREPTFSGQKWKNYNPIKSTSDRNSFESGIKQNKFIKTESNFFKSSGPKWSRNSLNNINSKNKKPAFGSGKSHLSLFKNFNLQNTNSNGIIKNILNPLPKVPSIFQTNKNQYQNQFNEKRNDDDDDDDEDDENNNNSNNNNNNNSNNVEYDEKEEEIKEELDLSNDFDQQLQITPKQFKDDN